MRFFVPQDLERNPELYRRARLLATYAVAATALISVFVPLYGLFGSFELGLFTAMTLVINVACVFVLKATGKVGFATNGFLLSLTLLFAGSTQALGGIHSPSLPAFVLVPTMAVFILGVRAGAIWLVISVAVIVGAAIFHSQGIGVVPVFDEEPLLVILAAGWVALVGLMFLLARAFNVTREVALARIAESQRLHDMIVRLDTVQESLESSTRQLRGDDGGLTREMREWAQSGRSSVMTSEAKLEEMIGQFGFIAARVTDLEQHAEALEELAAAIDRITRRLDILTINARLEAVKAGEHAEGFALVVSEMGNLADQAKRDSVLMRDVITTMRDAVHTARDAGEMGQRLTGQGSAELIAMSQTFEDMLQLIERVAEASEGMARDANRQIGAVKNLVGAALESQGSNDMAKGA